MAKADRPEDFPWCPEDAQRYQQYRILVKDLSPTQFATGKAEVMTKAERFRRRYKNDPRKLHDYLLVHPVPVVIRKGRYYLVDHHHLVHALYGALHEDLGDDLSVYVEVLFNASSLSESYFWKTMHAHNYVYLFDGDGAGPQPPSRLPKTIQEMGADPYRSLAWIVRDRHGYIKNPTPFSEFRWADFFRARLWPDMKVLEGKRSLDDHLFHIENGVLELTADGEELIDEALFLAKSPEAAGMPGYIGR